MTGNDAKSDLVNIMHIQNLIKFYQFVLNILSGNEILTSIKGHYSSTNVRQIMRGPRNFRQGGGGVQVSLTKKGLTFFFSFFF